jgi:hypothetical protein
MGKGKPETPKMAHEHEHIHRYSILAADGCLCCAFALCCSSYSLQLMNTELLPSLRKLEKQCEQYHEYAVTSQRNDMLKRLCVANDYMQTQK